jgi:hypothetical protein
MLGGLWRLAPGGAVVVSLVLAGCGGSSSSTSSTSSAGSAAASSSVSAAGSDTTAASATQTSVGTPSASAGAAAPTTSTSTTSTATADTGVRLPATFTIRAGGILLPGVVAAPTHTAVALTIVSGDGRGHAFLLQAPHRRMARVLPGRPLRMLLRGLQNGSYAVRVDGRVLGRLIIGATPGP